MQAMIFAAGLGIRLKPFTDKHPKALAIVNGKTLLQKNIENLLQQKIDFVVINVFYLAEQIIKYLEDNNGFGIHYKISNEHPEILETGGGLQKAFPLFKKNKSIVCINADILTDYNFSDLQKFHIQNNAFISLGVSNRSSSRYLLSDEKNILCGWKNIKTNETKIIRPSETYINKAFSGVSFFDYNIGKHFLEQKKYSLIDLFLHIGKEKKICMKDFSDNNFIDVGTPETLLKAQAMFL